MKNLSNLQIEKFSGNLAGRARKGSRDGIAFPPGGIRMIQHCNTLSDFLLTKSINIFRAINHGF
jgi:hypothetical protein